VYNYSGRPINLRNINAVRKFLCAPGKIGLAEATLTDIHKVKVIFVGEDANNTSKSMSLLLVSRLPIQFLR